LLDELYRKAEAIAKETADKLMQYHKSVAEIYYASNPLSINVDEVAGEDTVRMKALAEKFNEYQQEATSRAEFAPADKVKQAGEMEAIIKAGNERIRKLYDDALNEQKAG